VPPDTLLVVAPGGQTAERPLGDELVIGRDPGDELLGSDPELSRRHARITRNDAGALVLEDLDSTNGTWLNGWLIPSPQLLSPGDRVRVGQTELVLRSATEARRRSSIVLGLPGAEELRPARQSSVLYVDGVRKSYGNREVLRGVDLEVQPGEVVGLLGANGAGKTTLVSIVAGIRPADAGEVYVNGVDALRDSQAARRHLGLAPQDLGVYPTLSVRRNLRYFGEIAGLRGSELDERVEEIGSALSLEPIFDRPAGKLSGGQQRRLHTGMAMLHHPPLLILDEPTVGADVRTRAEILDLVKKLAGEGRAVCYSTHYLPEVEELGASVAVLEGGRIIARGSIAELIARHSSPAVELTFDGPAPELDLAGDISREDSVVRIKAEAPTEVAASVVAALGAHAQRLRSIEIIRPSLDSVYLALTERRYTSDRPSPHDAGGGTLTGRPARAAP
jgi:ABC-2 type transport system ATP-binding protein